MCHQCVSTMQFDQTLRSQGENLLRRLGVWEAVQHIGQIDRTVSGAHQLLRRAERAQVLGIDIGQEGHRKAEREFALARRHATSARQILGQVRAGAEWQELVNAADKLKGTRELTNALQEAQERWMASLLDAHLPAQDVSEIMEIWNSNLARFDTYGFAGLFIQLDERLGEFERILQEPENWGRNPHSPLEWWQWLLIAAILLIAIVALIACLWWFGCSWIYAIFAGVCIAAGGATGQGWLVGVCAGFVF